MSFLRTKVCRVVLPLLVSWVSYSGASAQVERVPKPQQLKLEIAPSKRTYSLGEAVLVRYKLTSLVDGTVCFPPPAIEAIGSFQGNLTLLARPRKPIAEEERDRFIESVWPRHPDEEEFRTSISRDWIKLGMSEPYLVPKSDKITVVNELGEWALVATYNPPDLTARDKEIVKSMGCTPPDVSIQSDSVTITIVNSTR